MAQEIDSLKEAEKAKLNSAFEMENDTLSVKQAKAQSEGDQSDSCSGYGWGNAAPWLILFGLILVSSSGWNWGVGWWVIPLMIFVVCKSGWGGRC